MKRRKPFDFDDSSSESDSSDRAKHVKHKISDTMETRAILYEGNFPYFREPREIGSFSLDSNRQFTDDKSQLKCFISPLDYDNCCFDLKKGYEKMIRKDETVKSYLNDLLRWTMLHKEKFLTQPTNNTTNEEKASRTSTSTQSFKSLNTDFVCWRGLLTRILCLPYENREDLRIAVVRTRGTYFMCQFDTEAKKKREEEMTERDKKMCAWGWKFEQYVTADEACGEPDTGAPVNNNEEYGVVMRSRLGSHSLVYGAEVDCTDPLDPKGEKYLELKTSRIIESRRQHENFCRFKLIKFWAQSFLIGIQRIVCGFRDDVGIVRHLKDYNVKGIPKLSSSVIRNGWDPSVCFNFLDSFLNFVKLNIPNDDERCVYVFYWRPGSKLVCEGRGQDDFCFLPDWFLEWEEWDKQAAAH